MKHFFSYFYFFSEWFGLKIYKIIFFKKSEEILFTVFGFYFSP